MCVLLVVGVGYIGVEGKVGCSGNCTEDDDGKHVGVVFGLVDAFGLFVHPAITDGLVGPFGHEFLNFPGPAVLELLLGGGDRRRGWVAFRWCVGWLLGWGRRGHYSCLATDFLAGWSRERWLLLLLRLI